MYEIAYLGIILTLHGGVHFQISSAKNWYFPSVLVKPAYALSEIQQQLNVLYRGIIMGAFGYIKIFRKLVVKKLSFYKNCFNFYFSKRIVIH